jgi:hypothetical protein
MGPHLVAELVVQLGSEAAVVVHAWSNQGWFRMAVWAAMI